MDIRVPKGGKMTLQIADAPKESVIFLRPRTGLALKLLAGVARDSGLKLQDEAHFEKVKSPTGLTMIDPMSPKIGELNVLVFKGMVANLPDAGKIGERVKVFQFPRSRDEWRRGQRWRPPPKPPTPEPDWRYRKFPREWEFKLPAWVGQLQIVVTTLQYGDVDVAAGGTLIIENSVTTVIANNFTMHTGARVVQRSPNLTVSISGQLVGVNP